MLSEDALVNLQLGLAVGRRLVEHGPSAMTAKVCFNSLLDLSDFLCAARRKEALLVRGVSLPAPAGLGFCGRLRGGRGDRSREPPGASERQGLEEEADRHHQAHQEGPGAESPTTQEHWATDHVQFSFTWPLSTLPEKS